MIFLYLLIIGVFAGFIGSIIGIGGGIIIVPVLTLALKIPIKYAIGTSIVSVLVTSLSATPRFFKKNIINMPLGFTLEIFTTIGAVAGSVAVSYLKSNVLFIIFGSFATIAGVSTFLRERFMGYTSTIKIPVAELTEQDISPERKNLKVEQETLIKRVEMEGETAEKKTIFDTEYFDESVGQKIKYKVKKVYYGSSFAVFAGLLSGMLGVGGGFIKVPIMNLVMNVPIKVAAATSNYMIGITAVVSSIVYFFNGYINPVLTIPLVTGIFFGALTGSFMVGKTKNKNIVVIVLLIYILIGTLMFLRAFDILNY